MCPIEQIMKGRGRLQTVFAVQKQVISYHIAPQPKGRLPGYTIGLHALLLLSKIYEKLADRLAKSVTLSRLLAFPLTACQPELGKPASQTCKE